MTNPPLRPPPDDDFPPLPDEVPLAPGGFRGWFWGTFLGPANAAGLGGWAGVFGPLGLLLVWAVFRSAPAGRRVAGADLALGLICSGAGSLIVGALVGGVGGRAVSFVERRRGAKWPPWRSQFLGGFAAGVLAVTVLAPFWAMLLGF